MRLTHLGRSCATVCRKFSSSHAISGRIAILLGLASQNTLADVFSGIALGLGPPFHIGDRVSIGDDAEGVVVQMNRRSIRVQTDGEDIAMIPNSIVAQNLITNRNVPTPRRAIQPPDDRPDPRSRPHG